MRNLVVLAADKDMEQGVRHLLRREISLGIRPIDAEIYVHPQHDPGCFAQCDGFLRSMSGRFAFALVMLDREGSGQEWRSREQMEVDIEERLSSSGWDGRCGAVVLDPELEVWVWAASAEVDATIGWPAEQGRLRQLLESLDQWPADQTKPSRPKEALEYVLRQIKKPRSSSIYAALADRLGLTRCTDPSFAKFCRLMTDWFPPFAERDK